MQTLGIIILREMCSDTSSPESADEVMQESRSEVNEMANISDADRVRRNINIAGNYDYK
jgi:hypothetical protein